MSNRVGIIVVSVASITDFFGGAINLPEGTQVLETRPSLENPRSIEMMIRHPSFPIIPEFVTLPYYKLVATKNAKGEVTTSFRHTDGNEITESVVFSDRFEAEQAFMSLWTLFDYLQNIQEIVNRTGEEEIDSAINAALGLHTLMVSQKGIAYQYNIMKATSPELQTKLDLIIKELDATWGLLLEDYISTDRFLTSIKEIRDEGNEVCEKIFDEFEALVASRAY